MQEKDNVIIKLTFQFALDIIKYCEGLQENKKFVIANQLVKSGTSIGANIR
jgi:four helix bundle protein